MYWRHGVVVESAVPDFQPLAANLLLCRHMDSPPRGKNVPFQMCTHLSTELCKAAPFNVFASLADVALSTVAFSRYVRMSNG